MVCTPGDEEEHGFILRTKLWKEALEMGGSTCTCGGCGTDGFGPDARSKSREVDNEISIRGEP